jgi:hypothetical protein
MEDRVETVETEEIEMLDVDSSSELGMLSSNSDTIYTS